ncbi:MAG: glycosyltransferase family 4 protein [Deltaproteobacteria bacterium]|nr:glycosyltransferase family 4 protein [Deltaproteobacteria bacterium]
MHLLCLTHLFYPARGGTETALLELARQLVNRGQRVTVLTSNQTGLEDFSHPRFHPALLDEEKLDGIHIIRLRLSRFQRTLLAKLGALCLRSRSASGQALWFMAHVPHLPGMIRKAEQLQPDILYAVPFPTATPYYAWQAARRLGCPWVIQPHIHEAQMNDSLLAIIDWLFPRASAILTNTEPEKNFLAARGLEASKIRVFGQGLPERAQQPGDGAAFRRRLGLGDQPLVVFLGRKAEGKGLELLLEAMAQIRSEVPEAVLLLAGQTSPYFRDLLEGNPSARSHQVRSLDDFPEGEKNDLLAAADVLALPSAIESFGVVFLEAWAQKKPVVGADIPAVAALIENGKDGLLVPAGDAPALGAALVRLLKDPGLRQALGAAGAAKVRERYEVGKVAAGMESFFQELIEENRQRRAEGKA